METIDPAERRKRLSARQQMLLEERIRGARPAAKSILRRHAVVRCPVSYAQEPLWFLDQLGLVGSAYNLPFEVRLSGPLDVTALERSLREIVRRHEVLRTRLEVEVGQPVQVIGPPGAFRLERVDVSGLAKDVRETEILRLVSTGMSNREIATTLVLSEHTVHRHIANILRKLSLSNRAAAATHAARVGII